QAQVEVRGLGLRCPGGRASQRGDRVVERTELVSRLPEADEGIEAIGVAREDLLEPARGYLITFLGERGSSPPIGSGASGEQRGGQERHQSGVPLSHGSDIAEEHTSELQSRFDLVCRLLLEKKKKTTA